MNDKITLTHYFKQFSNAKLISALLDVVARIYKELKVKETDADVVGAIDIPTNSLQLYVHHFGVLQYQIRDRKHYVGLLTTKKAADNPLVDTFESWNQHILGEEELGLAWYTASSELLQNPSLLETPLKVALELYARPKKKRANSLQQNNWIYRAAMEATVRAEILENIKAIPKYQPLLPKTIKQLLQKAPFSAIKEADDFYLAKAQAILMEIEASTIANKALEKCLLDYQQYDGRFDAFVANAVGEDYGDFVLLLGQLVAHIDYKATAKQQWNRYVDKRTIGNTGIRQHLWVQQIISYKKAGNDLSAISTPVVRNALAYLKYPAEHTPILSPQHQAKIAEHILDSHYQPRQFTLQLISYFNQFGISTNCFDNYTLLIAQLLYDDTNKSLWKYSEDEIYQSEILDIPINEPTINYQQQIMPQVPLNQILYGPPGTGKTFESIRKAIAIIERKEWALVKQWDATTLQQCQQAYTETGQFVFTTFHQSMSYEDFIEGIKPQLEDNQTTYKIEDGILKLLVKQANQHPNRPFVLIIDEINRGNVANIFGEIITLLEEDKREGAVHALSVQLPYSKQLFSLPSNLYVIGTMNTTDRSVEQLDMALRRRFSFVEMEPDALLLSEDIEGINLRLLHQKINERLSILLDDNHLLGHAYFMDIRSLEQLQILFKTQLIPLLLEYFYGDCAKVGLVLGEDFVATNTVQQQQMARFDYDHQERFWDKPSYKIRSFPLDKNAYVHVYE